MTEVRATKRQKELLSFVDNFIKGHGYGPSYREIMRALGYKSVSTVAVHINGLITAGYIIKKDNSARSIEVISLGDQAAPKQTRSVGQKWYIAEIEKRFKALETTPSQTGMNQLHILIESLKILELDDEYVENESRLDKLRAGILDE